MSSYFFLKYYLSIVNSEFHRRYIVENIISHGETIYNLTPEDKESNNNDDHENGGVQEEDVGDVRPGDAPRLLSGPDDPVVEVWLTADMANI